MFSKHDILLESQLGRNVIKKATAIYRRRLGRNDVHLWKARREIKNILTSRNKLTHSLGQRNFRK